MKLKWQQAPVKTQWGDDMVVASVAINKDHTVCLYCERDQTPKVDAMFALAEQPAQQEPVAYAVKTVGGKKWHSIHAVKESSDKWFEYRVKEQAQGETYEQFALYTSPQPAQRKPLTIEQREEIAKGWRGRNWTVGDIIDAVEAAHGIKENT